MPIYEYQCENCGHRLEALQKISDQPLTECPACDKPGLKKLVSAASFRLKGGGWYETDFKSGDKKHLADSGDGKPADRDSKDSKAGSTDKQGKQDKQGKKDKADKPATTEKSGAAKTKQE